MAIKENTILSVHDDELTLLEAVNDLKQKYEEASDLLKSAKPIYWHKLELSATSTTGDVTTPVYLSVLSHIETNFTKSELSTECLKTYPLICVDDDSKLFNIYLMNENIIYISSISDQPTDSTLTNWTIDDDTRTLL